MAGIKKGTVAYDEHSSRLNNQLTIAKNELEEKLSSLGYMLKRRLRREEVPGGLEGINPDGGIWCDSTGKVVAIFEAKKQGSSGNAHERWYKNQSVASYLYPDVKYVTFCCGSGVSKKSTMYKGFGFALARELKDPHSWNVLHDKGVSFFRKKSGYTTKQIKKIMLAAILGGKI